MNVDVPTLARAVQDRIVRSGWIPTLRMGTTSDGGTTPLVTLDGDADPIQAQALGDPAAVDERVWCVVWRGLVVVLGRAGGQRLMGKSTATGDQLGITTAITLTDLSVEVVVTQPGRSLRVEGQVQVQASTAGGEVTGQIQQDGVTVGRYGRFTVARNNQVNMLSGFTYVDDLSPGGYTFSLTLSCATTGSVNTNSATIPSWIAVHDVGPA